MRGKREGREKVEVKKEKGDMERKGEERRMWDNERGKREG